MARKEKVTIKTAGYQRTSKSNTLYISLGLSNGMEFMGWVSEKAVLKTFADLRLATGIQGEITQKNLQTIVGCEILATIEQEPGDGRFEPRDRVRWIGPVVEVSSNQGADDEDEIARLNAFVAKKAGAPPAGLGDDREPF